MKLSYPDGSVPPWLHWRARQMISRTIDLENRYIHITQLISPAPQLRLMADNWDALEQPIDDLIPAMVGTAWHKYMEGAMGSGFTEHRIEYQHGDWTIIGSPDWYSHDSVIDFKTTKVWSRIFLGEKYDWEQQLNLYRWLIYQATGVLVSSASVHAVYLDWSAAAAMRTAGYPPKRWEVIEMPLWSVERARQFVDLRLAAIESVQPGDYCTPAERWERGAHWALKREGRKTALKKYDTHEEALAAKEAFDLIPHNRTYYIEEREGVPVRCLNWCPARKFCAYGKALEVQP